MKSRINGGNTNGLSDGRKEGRIKQVGKTEKWTVIIGPQKFDFFHPPHF